MSMVIVSARPTMCGIVGGRILTARNVTRASNISNAITRARYRYVSNAVYVGAIVVLMREFPVFFNLFIDACVVSIVAYAVDANVYSVYIDMAMLGFPYISHMISDVVYDATKAKAEECSKNASLTTFPWVTPSSSVNFTITVIAVNSTVGARTPVM
ncbi:hypothetical protein B7L70_02310 [Vulcanisaeta sp. EB80]|uniref:hypothetical protein n=1 Tax=Vulcanisaeta sp. EB80 TaxID=1650660 RepID=UPI0009BF81E5|nr:hypothetical protein [Vulcanisaeta sp. EB80]PLC68599.1 hypothetical protein B7L70_02310 [Vulcanisaeta sp. EB80]